MPKSTPRSNFKRRTRRNNQTDRATQPHVGKLLSIPTGYQRAPIIADNTRRQSEVVTFSRWSQATAITTSTSIEVVNSYNFKLNQVGNSTDITSAFDTYRITRVDVYFTPRVSMTTDASILTNAQLWTAIDFDGNTVTTITDTASYSTAQMHDARHSFVVSLKPRAILASYASGAFTATAEAPSNQWLDCSNAAVEHYGLITAISAQAAITVINVAVRFFIEAKRSR
jgi:hypothetical protein